MRSYINAIASTVKPTNMHSQQSNKYAFQRANRSMSLHFGAFSKSACGSKGAV